MPYPISDEAWPFDPDAMPGGWDNPQEPYDWTPEDWPHEVFPCAVSTFPGEQPDHIPGQLELSCDGVEDDPAYPEGWNS